MLSGLWVKELSLLRCALIILGSCFFLNEVGVLFLGGSDPSVEINFNYTGSQSRFHPVNSFEMHGLLICLSTITSGYFCSEMMQDEA